MRRWIIIIIIIAAIGAAGYFGWRIYDAQSTATTVSNYQTAVISRGGLTATVGATGLVRSNQSSALVWQASGTVETVNVEVGSDVRAGEVIAVLAADSLAQNVILAQADLINAQKALDDLQKSDLATYQAWQAVLQARQAQIEAERAFDPYETQDYRDDLDDARSEVVDTEEKLNQATEDFDPYKDFDEDNATRKRFKDRLEDAQQDYDEAVRSLDLLQLEKQNVENNLSLTKARLADAEREYERLKDGPNPDDVTALEARITAAKATLSQSEITASFDSTVTSILFKAGDQISPGAVAVRLDDLSRLLVDVRVSEVDINRVALGQPVLLSFDAILGKEYNGIVSEIASIGTTTQGVVEFIVTVELTDADENVRPGMTAAVNIVVEELTNVLLIPNRAVRVQDGQRVVYLLRNNELVQVRVTLGSSSDLESEITEGDIRTGEVIVLNPPQIFETNGPPPFVQR